MKACCGFGHRNVFENISSKLDNAVEEAIAQGCEIFYTGAMGDFDSLFSSAVRSAKKVYPHIKLAGIHPKAAIKARNRWMIDNSDIVLIYTVRNFGGAYEAKRFAERNGKRLIKI